MVYFTNNAKKRNSPSKLKWTIYAVVLAAVLAFFIPKMLVNKGFKIIEEEIPADKATADSCPKSSLFNAYNMLEMAKLFPGFSKSTAEGQKRIFDYHLPLFKEDYNKLKFACVDNAISFLKTEGTTPADSINIKALSTEWHKHPDSVALADFQSKWELYHKYFASSLPEYPRFIDNVQQLKK